MRLNAEESCVLVIDIQERLVPVIHQSDSMVENTAWLLEVARRLNVPALFSEQYPKGLGHTVPALADYINADNVFEKVNFSAAGEAVYSRIGSERQQFVITGCESHICVLQTALELLENGRQVFVLEEAVSSRTERDKALALARMQQAGAAIVSREMVAFEWLRQAGTDAFKSISREMVK